MDLIKMCPNCSYPWSEDAVVRTLVIPDCCIAYNESLEDETS